MRVAVQSSASKPYQVVGVKGGFAPLHPLRGRGCPPSPRPSVIAPTTPRPLPGLLGAFLGSPAAAAGSPRQPPPGGEAPAGRSAPLWAVGGGRRARRGHRPRYNGAYSYCKAFQGVLFYSP